MLKYILDRALSEYVKSFISWGSDTTESFISSLDRSLISGGTISTVYMAQEHDPIIVKDITYALSDIGFIKSSVLSKYASVELIESKLYEYESKSEIDSYKVHERFKSMILRRDIEHYPATLVRSNGVIKETGLSRLGFAKVAKNDFQFDTIKLSEYREPIVQTIVKSIQKSVENGNITDKFFLNEANYQVIAELAVDYYIADPSQRFNLEQNISDSRGRATFKALKRIGNPIQFKDFRALLIVPEPTVINVFSRDKLNDIYYFIAELIGTDADTVDGKYIAGRMAYEARSLPQIDLTMEHDRTELHELIWLERIYDKLDELDIQRRIFWDIPLEVDASMSINQYVGALTNDARLLSRTNVIGDTLTDPWYIEGVKRIHGKFVGTPVFYGSSQAATTLLRANGVTPDMDEVRAINQEFRNGAFAVTKAFKDCVIDGYSNHAPAIQIQIADDTFNVECNKFKVAGSTRIFTTAWDSDLKRMRTAVTHEPIRIPDYDRFKLFWATCLIHNLDSQDSNSIALEISTELVDHESLSNWIITIHDAALTLPGTCRVVRNKYAKRLKRVNTNRDEIISNFRASIGATSMKSDVSFMKLHRMVEQADDVEFNASAMK